MKANELMVGDWVNTPNGISRVIYIAKYSGIYTDNTNIGEKLYSPYEINPIPLTPEILEKNGIIRKSAEDADAFRFLKDDISIVECFANIEGRYRCIISYGETRLRKTICFVHELQHALRLCGIDKEITM